MLVGLDHLIIACADPDTAAAEIEQMLGLRAAPGGRHDAHGTYNRLIWLGDSYVELMGVFDARRAAESWWGTHIVALLEADRAAHAGVVLASDDLAADVDRLRSVGAELSDSLSGDRVRPDGDVVRWRISRPPAPDPDLGLMFLIEHDPESAEWRSGDRAIRAAQTHPLGTPAHLSRIEMPSPDVRSATLRLLRHFGLQFRPSLAGRGARDTSVGSQTLRLVPPGAGALPRVAIRAGRAPCEADLLGYRWQLAP